MNAVILWIGVPAGVSLLLLLLRRSQLLVIGVATTLSLLLGLAAIILPIGETLTLGPLTIAIDPVVTFFGRRLLIADTDRGMLTLLYLMGAFWFFGSSVMRVNTLLVPLGLLITAVSVAALSVEPFLYSAMLVEVIVLLTIPIAAPPGARERKGVMRYLSYLTMGMPFILLAGWAADRVQVNLSDQIMLTQAIALLVIGFVFWLAIFPFSAWVAGMLHEVHPYVGGYILTALSTTVLLLLVDFINAFSWLRNLPGFSLGLLAVGLIVVVTSGFAAIFQPSLPRLYAMAYRFSIGLALLALAPLDHSGYLTFLGLLPVRLVSMALFALTLGVLKDRTGSLDYADLRESRDVSVFASIGLPAALAAMAGLPLFGNFSLTVAIARRLGEFRLLFPFIFMLGSVILLTGGARAVFYLTDRSEITKVEDYREIVLIVLGIIVLILAGTFPSVFMPFIFNLLKSYPLLI